MKKDRGYCRLFRHVVLCSLYDVRFDFSFNHQVVKDSGHSENDNSRCYGFPKVTKIGLNVYAVHDFNTRKSIVSIFF